MFILLKSGAMFNLFWLQDCFQGKHDKNIVIFYTINGTKIVEEYDTEQEAKDRVNSIHKTMESAGRHSSVTEIVNELPTGSDIDENKIYLVKAEDGEDNDMFEEYVYIDGKWEQWGRKKVDITPLQEQLDEQAELIRKQQEQIDELYEMLKWKEY